MKLSCRVLIAFFALEVMRLSGAQPLDIANMSVRLSVEPSQPMTVGFVVTNSNGGADGAVTRVLVRAAGPSLRPFGVSGADRLTMSVNAGPATRVIARWTTDSGSIVTAANSVGAFPFVTSAVGDDALIIETSAAALTITVFANTRGEAIVEAYKLPDPPPPPPPPVVMPIKAPTGLVVTRALGLSITLDWEDSTEPDFSRYRIYRALANQPTGSALVAEQRSASAFTDTGLALGVRYYYWVTTVLSGSRESARSNPTSGVANSGI